MNSIGLLKANGEIDEYGNTGGGSTDTSALVNKTDLTAIILTGSTNTSGSTITSGTWFYLNGTPCVAKVDIASGATFTLNTNYEEKTVGSALSELNSNTYIIEIRTISGTYDSNGMIVTDAFNFDSTTYRPVSAWCNYITWGEYPKRVYMEMLTNTTARIALWGSAGQTLHEASIYFLCTKRSNINDIVLT